MMLFWCDCEVSSIECGKCIVGVDGGKRWGTEAAADCYSTHEHVVCCTAWSARTGLLLLVTVVIAII